MDYKVTALGKPLGGESRRIKAKRFNAPGRLNKLVSELVEVTPRNYDWIDAEDIKKITKNRGI